jgi:hypothetical protein
VTSLSRRPPCSATLCCAVRCSCAAFALKCVESGAEQVAAAPELAAGFEYLAPTQTDKDGFSRKVGAVVDQAKR